MYAPDLTLKTPILMLVLFLSLVAHSSQSILHRGRSITSSKTCCMIISLTSSDTATRHDVPSASSQARPAPNPAPNKTGQALLLNRSTENITPNDAPRPVRIRPLDNALSHCDNLSVTAHFSRCTTPQVRSACSWLTQLPLVLAATVFAPAIHLHQQIQTSYLLVKQCLAHRSRGARDYNRWIGDVLVRHIDPDQGGCSCS